MNEITKQLLAVIGMCFFALWFVLGVVLCIFAPQFHPAPVSLLCALGTASLAAAVQLTMPPHKRVVPIPMTTITACVCGVGLIGIAGCALFGVMRFLK